MKQVRGQNRRLHKCTILKGGVRKANKSPRYVFGFQLFDKVSYKGQECFIFGRRASGKFDIRLLNGTKVSSGVRYKNLLPIEKASTMLIQYAKPTELKDNEESIMGQKYQIVKSKPIPKQDIPKIPGHTVVRPLKPTVPLSKILKGG